MANYNLVIPTVTELCRKINVPNAMVGIIIGCCDIATIPGTIGTPRKLVTCSSALPWKERTSIPLAPTTRDAFLVSEEDLHVVLCNTGLCREIRTF